MTLSFLKFCLSDDFLGRDIIRISNHLCEILEDFEVALPLVTFAALPCRHFSEQRAPDPRLHGFRHLRRGQLHFVIVVA